MTTTTEVPNMNTSLLPTLSVIESSKNITTPLPENITSESITTITTVLTNFCCPSSDDDVHLNFNFTTNTTTTEASISVTELVHKFQRTIWTQDDYGSYVPYDEQYTTPTSILLLNLFLVIFLMIVIGIAVYPAAKKYFDSTFFSGRGGNTRYWIEDNNEEVVSILNSSIPECSFALLNGRKNTMATTEDDSSSSCSLEILTEVRSDLT